MNIYEYRIPSPAIRQHLETLVGFPIVGKTLRVSEELKPAIDLYFKNLTFEEYHLGDPTKRGSK